MKNYLTEADFLPNLPRNRAITVTTDYIRPDTETPFVNSVVLRKLSREGRIQVEKVKGPYKYRVSQPTE